MNIKLLMMRLSSALSLCFFLFIKSTIAAADPGSQCFGTVAKGHIENAIQLSLSGKNFQAYSDLTGIVGRNYVHTEVGKIVLSAYKAMEATLPDHVFVYGETGWKNGGRIRPHKTHRNGVSVDFMVPVLDEKRNSVPLPTNMLNKFGYAIDFDQSGHYENLTIDFDAVAEHLYQLKQAALSLGYDITLVIIDPPYLPLLYASKRGEYIQKNIKFMQGKAWIRHDEHYHVDFAIPCKQEK